MIITVQKISFKAYHTNKIYLTLKYILYLYNEPYEILFGQIFHHNFNALNSIKLHITYYFHSYIVQIISCNIYLYQPKKK